MMPRRVVGASSRAPPGAGGGRYGRPVPCVARSPDPSRGQRLRVPHWTSRRAEREAGRRLVTAPGMFTGGEEGIPPPPTSIPKPAFYSEPVEDAWGRLMSVEKSLRVAVELENYALAAKLRDQQAQLQEAMPMVQKYILQLVRKVRDESLPREDILEAAQSLGEVGHSWDAVPELSQVLHRAARDEDAELTQVASEAMWRVFMRSSNPRVGSLMETGMQFMRVSDLRGAVGVFDDMIRLEPSFAEGYNKRATVLYMMDRYPEAVEDCRMVLDLEPYHFGALSGMGMCLLRMGDYKGALEAFQRTLQVHPGLTEIRKMCEDLRLQMGQQGSLE